MIYLNEKLRISKADERNLQLEAYLPTVSKKTNETSMQWKWIGYYGDLKSALAGALKQQIFELADQETESISTLIVEITKAEQNVINAAKQLQYK